VHSIKLFWNLSLLLSNSSLGNGNLKQQQNNNNSRISIAPYGRYFGGAWRQVGSLFSESLIEGKVLN